MFNFDCRFKEIEFNTAILLTRLYAIRDDIKERIDLSASVLNSECVGNSADKVMRMFTMLDFKVFISDDSNPTR